MADKTVTDLADSMDLTDVLDLLGFSPADVEQLGNGVWAAVAVVASQRVGRQIENPTTGMRVLVLSRLTERHRLANTNPLQGIGMRG